jgi:hypothetical protein
VKTPKRRKPTAASGPDAVSQQDVAAGLAGLITSIKPLALCDSCIALDVRVSFAEAHEASVSAGMSTVFERTLQRCHRCGRTVEAICAR